MLALRYGAAARLCLELEGEALVAFCDSPRGEPLSRVVEAVRAALAAPLEFPPLVQAALPGDKVVLALEHGVPQAATIVAQTIEALTGAGVDPRDIVLLRSKAGANAAEPDPLAAVSGAIREAVASRVHDPANRDALSYLAATADAQPIYINRAIHDADLVISIGVLRLPDSLGYLGVNSALYPAFSDAASIERYHAQQAAAQSRQDKLRRKADEVGWLLGVQFTIQVVPAAADGILHVVAGELDAVRREGGRLCEAAWSFTVPRPASLVVAAIEGDATQQTWENVARALAAASHALDDDGAVVLCSELAEPLGPGLQHIVGADDLPGVLDEIARERPADALEAAQLVRSLERGKVYLVSRLEDETVEELGLLPLDAEGVSRVARRYPSCIVLANAQHAQARTESQSAAPQPAGRKSR
jgi:nickel-dependent lactate racemase